MKYSLPCSHGDYGPIARASGSILAPILIITSDKTKNGRWINMKLTSMASCFEFRSSDNAVVKPEGGSSTQDAAKTAGHENAKKMKNSRQPGRPDVGRITVRQNAEKSTRY